MFLVSIILPTYNGEKYVAQAIESCLAQTYSNIELIIVNDCSSDETGAIAQDYAGKDSRIRIVTNEQNRQLPASLNIGFRQAKGEFFTWTSDDNYYAPEAIETLLRELHRSPECDIVYSSYRFVNKDGKTLETYGGEPEHLIFTCIVGACFLYRRKVHAELGGYAEDRFRMEDMDFWLRAAAKFRFSYIDSNKLYFYRKHQQSLTFDIYRNASIYEKYRNDYLDSFKVFFNEVLDAGFSLGDIQAHLNVFFEDLLKVRTRDFTLGEQLTACLGYLDNLQNLSWENIGFDKQRINRIISEKKNGIVHKIVNDLVFENKVLAGKNPAIAAHLQKPLSWYYQEYEVLPSWYKQLGHVLKVLRGNKPIRSLFTNSSIK
jgi:glycosyltransferase involved in cell wall biosynthesis